MVVATRLVRFREDALTTPVLGTHFWPLRIFAPSKDVIETNDDLAEIRWTFSIGEPVLILRVTRASTVVVDEPEINGARDGRQFEMKLKFQENFRRAANMLFAEMALRGVVSEPLTETSIGVGIRTETHAVIEGMASGREAFLERTIGPIFSPETPAMRRGNSAALEAIESAGDLPRARRLATVWSTLPSFVSHAYYALARRYMESAIVHGWIVIEQFIDKLWTTMTAHETSARRRRFGDHRNYSAAQRLDVLQSVGCLPAALVEQAHDARGHRNALAHRAAGGAREAEQVLGTMRSFLVRFFEGDESIAHPSANEVLAW